MKHDSDTDVDVHAGLAEDDVEATLAGGGSGAAVVDTSASLSPPLFDEFYDDWATFDAAVGAAIAQHHPIRKRSSLTFEVYNRTVSKGSRTLLLPRVRSLLWSCSH